MALPALQLDLLTVIKRLEQIRDELAEPEGFTRGGMWLWLLEDRVLTCDLVRLRSHLSAEALAFEAEEEAGELAQRPVMLRLVRNAPRVDPAGLAILTRVLDGLRSL